MDPLRYLRGARDRLLFYFRYHPVSGWSGVIFITSLILYACDLVIRNEWAVAVAIASGALSSYRYFRRRYQVNRMRIFDHPLYPSASLESAAKEQGLGVERQGFNSQRVALFDPALNAIVTENPIAINLDHQRYVLPFPLAEYAYDLLVKRGTRWDSTNENKIRISSAFDHQNLIRMHKVKLSRTDYYSDYLTNRLASKFIRNVDGTTFFDPETLYLHDGKLILLDQSPASNHIGGSTLVVTDDARLVYQFEVRGASGYGIYNASANGSLDWEDIAKATRTIGRTPTLQELVTFALERELVEEISATKLRQSRATFVTGIARLLERGLKPDVFGLTLLRQASTSLKIPSREQRFAGHLSFEDVGELTTSGVLKKLGLEKERFRKKQDCATSLFLAVVFAEQFLSRQEEDFVERFFQQGPWGPI